MFSDVWMAVAVTLVALTMTGWRALSDLELIARRRDASTDGPEPERLAALIPIRPASSRTVA